MRSNVALTKNELLPFTLPATHSGSQPCRTWGLHPNLPRVKALLAAGDVSFLANIGTLIHPLTMSQYDAKTVARPGQLFSHKTQTVQTQTVHAQHTGAKGILGRMNDALGKQPS
eukprot:COSAG01_NODE_13532_length_1572_cov_0.949084_1_plen_113_part_10